MIRIAAVAAVLAVLGWYYITFIRSPAPGPAPVSADSIRPTRPPFQAPSPGEKIRVELLTGAAREGVVRRVDADSVTVETPHGEVTYARGHIAPESRRQLFRADHDAATLIDAQNPSTVQGAAGAPPDPSEFGPNVQYVIAGTNAIVIYGPQDTPQTGTGK